MTTTAHVVLCTAPNADEARRLARAVVEARLAACVNLLPAVRSIYRWEGEVHEDEEVLLVVKTAADRVEALVAFLVEHHPYEVPEAIALPITAGSEPYLAWVRDETRPG
jgi:periplasmic divalent cation tolerance protein